MFKAPFSFTGRIRRLEYGLSLIIYCLGIFVSAAIIGFLDMDSMQSGSSDNKFILLFLLVLAPAIWFVLAQSSKRCHDLGKSGWWHFVPFYGFALLFQEGNTGPNEYGNDPKHVNPEQPFHTVEEERRNIE